MLTFLMTGVAFDNDVCKATLAHGMRNAACSFHPIKKRLLYVCIANIVFALHLGPHLNGQGFRHMVNALHFRWCHLKSFNKIKHSVIRIMRTTCQERCSFRQTMSWN